MSGTRYLVEIELVQIGDLPGKASPGIDKLGDSLKSLEKTNSNLKSSFFDLGSSMAGAFTGAVEKIAGVGVDLLKLAAIGAGGAVAYGVVGLNKELENTQMSIGAILNAAGQVPDIGSGLKLGGDIMSKMRRDASELPGEFSDLIGIFRSIATTGFSQGMNTKGLEDMSAKAMAAGAVMGLQSPMVGRELAMALEGRVGAHNVFATRLGLSGDDATKFRGMDAAHRIEDLTSRLAKYQGAIDAFKTSFEAQSSTLVDNGKKFLGEATLPLFEKVKTELKSINDWFDNNQETVSIWTLRIGNGLGAAFDTGKSIFMEYGPLLWEFAGNAYSKLSEIWTDMKPGIMSVGEVIKEALKDPGTLDKIIDALKLYAAIKGAGAISSGLGGIASVGSAAGQLGNAASGIASTASAAGGMESLMVSASGAASALFLAAAAAAAAYAAYKVHEEYSKAVAEATEIQRTNTEMMVDNLQNWTDSSNQIDTNTKSFASAVEDARNSVGWFSEALSEASSFLHSVIHMGQGSGTARGEAEAAFRAEVEHRNNQSRLAKDVPDYGTEAMHRTAMLVGAGLINKKEEKKKDPKPPAGPTVYVSMTISSNQSPGQIARRAVDFIMAEARNPKASRSVPNYSAVNR